MVAGQVDAEVARAPERTQVLIAPAFFDPVAEVTSPSGFVMESKSPKKP